MRIWPSRRTVKRWGIGLALVVGLLLAANGVMAWRTEARSNAIKEAIRAAGDPASIAELRPAPIAKEANAAAQIAELAEALKLFSKDHITFLERTELGKALDNADALPNAEQAAAMRIILDKHAAMGEGITRAAACNAWASVGDFAVDHHTFLEQLLERIQNFRGVMRYANWEVAVLTAEGKRDDAVGRGIDILKLARVHEAEPTLVAYLVSVAVRGMGINGLDKALAAGPVSREARAALDEELARADRPGQFAAMLRLERGAALDAFPGAAGNRGPMRMRLLGWPVHRYYLEAYEMFAHVIAEAEGAWPEFRRYVQPWQGGGKTGQGVLADLLAPAIAAAVEARDRDLALLRSLRAVNALQGFAAENGREASGLAEAGLPTEAVVDPYRDEPLIATHAEEGWRVYSVGKNERDDGGRFEEWLDVGVGVTKGE